MNRSLFSREFTFASVAYFFVFLSASIFYLFPLFLDQFHPSKSLVGLIMGVHSVTAIMVRPLFGRLLDKRGGRRVAIGGLLVMIAGMPGFYLIQRLGHRGPHAHCIPLLVWLHRLLLLHRSLGLSVQRCILS